MVVDKRADRKNAPGPLLSPAENARLGLWALISSRNDE